MFHIAFVRLDQKNRGSEPFNMHRYPLGMLQASREIEYQYLDEVIETYACLVIPPQLPKNDVPTTPEHATGATN